MKLVIQPDNVGCCGQACCAMLTGIPLEDVCLEFGHSHASYTREVVKFLKNHGYKCSEKMKRLRKGEIPKDPSILKMLIGNRKNGHVVVFHDGICWDPSLGKRHIKEYDTVTENGERVRLTSFLALEKTQEAAK